jgi:hypothetical protein
MISAGSVLSQSMNPFLVAALIPLTLYEIMRILNEKLKMKNEK